MLIRLPVWLNTSWIYFRWDLKRACSIVLKLKSLTIFWSNEKKIAKMKFMKLGTRPDTFFTENATRCVDLSPISVSIKAAYIRYELYPVMLLLQCRSVISDIPSDLVIRINNINFLLHQVWFSQGHKWNLSQMHLHWGQLAC